MRKYLFAVLKCGWDIFVTYFFFVKRAYKRKDKYSEEVRYNRVRKLIKHVLKSLNADIHVEGLENLPNQAFGLISDHLSMIDPLVYIDILDKKTTVVAKKELLKAPFVPAVLDCIDGKFIDRDDLKQTLRIMMGIQDDLAANNYNWLIFPEGTRNKDPEKKLLEFHHGTFRSAYKAHAPIVPAVIFGTRELMSTKTTYKKYPIFVKFLKPLYYEDYKDMDTTGIAKMVQSLIQKEVMYSGRPFVHQYFLKNEPKKYEKQKM